MSSIFNVKRKYELNSKILTLLASFGVFIALLAYSLPVMASGPGDPPDQATTERIPDEMQGDRQIETQDKLGAVSKAKPDNMRDPLITDQTPAPLADKVTTINKSGEKCYLQKDESYECVCEGKGACDAMKASEICAPGTIWGKEDGLGGCTKKK